MVLAAPGPLLTPPPSSSPPKTPHRSYSAQTRSQDEEKNPPPKPYLPPQTRTRHRRAHRPHVPMLMRGNTPPTTRSLYGDHTLTCTAHPSATKTRLGRRSSRPYLQIGWPRCTHPTRRHGKRSQNGLRYHLSRHDPTSPDATPLSPDARRDTTNDRPKVRAMPSVRSFIISQIWNLQRLVSPRQPRLYLVFPP
jgi:hypothetical protein